MITNIQEKTGASVRKICTVLGLARSSYYHAAKETITQINDQIIGEEIKTIFTTHKSRYGYRRIRKELQKKEITCSPARTRRLMKTLNLAAIQPRSFRPTTSDGRADAPSKNLLLDAELPKQVNEVWVGDITYIQREGGWFYLAVVMDRCSRRIVGWSIDTHMGAKLVIEAMRQAETSRKSKTQKTIFHSDRGSQYGSKKIRSYLKDKKFIQSMSRRANPYDNAAMESFMGTLKLEAIGKQSFATIEQARIAIFEYINAYYNTQRIHSSIEYLTPSEFEKQQNQH